MIRRALLALGIVGAALLLARGASDAPRPSVEPSPRVRPSPAAPPAAPPLVRDPFRFATEAPAPAATTAAATERHAVVPVPDATPTPWPIRLSGYVRRGGTLKAAIVFSGSMVIAGPGDQIEGYTVLSVDEDAGVRVRATNGEEFVLRPG